MARAQHSEKADYRVLLETFAGRLFRISRRKRLPLYANHRFELRRRLRRARRFNRLDPFFGNLREPQSLHKYAYAYSDPVGRLDSSGQMSLGESLSVLRTSASLVARNLPAMFRAAGPRGIMNAFVQANRLVFKDMLLHTHSKTAVSSGLGFVAGFHMGLHAQSPTPMMTGPAAVATIEVAVFGKTLSLLRSVLEVPIRAKDILPFTGLTRGIGFLGGAFLIGYNAGYVTGTLARMLIARAFED